MTKFAFTSNFYHVLYFGFENYNLIFIKYVYSFRINIGIGREKDFFLRTGMILKREI